MPLARLEEPGKKKTADSPGLSHAQADDSRGEAVGGGGWQTMGAEPTQLLPRALTIQNDEVVTISMNNVNPSLLRENVGPSLSTKLSPRIRNQSKTKPFPEQNDAGGPTCKEIKTSQSKPSITQECPHPKPHSAQCFK